MNKDKFQAARDEAGEKHVHDLFGDDGSHGNYPLACEADFKAGADWAREFLGKGQYWDAMIIAQNERDKLREALEIAMKYVNGRIKHGDESGEDKHWAIETAAAVGAALGEKK